MPWELTVQPVERPARADSEVTGLTLFWQETVRDSCTQALSLHGQTRDDDPTEFLDTLKKWHQENAAQLQQQSVALVIRGPINRASVQAILEAFNQIGWIGRFSIETDGAEKSEEAIALEREAQAVVIRNKLFKQLAINIHTPYVNGRNLWDVFIEQILQRRRELKTDEIVGREGGGENYKKLIESTGREGIAAYIRYLLRYSESEQADSEFGLILDYFFAPQRADAFLSRVLQDKQWRPVDILELMHEEQQKQPGRQLSRSRVSFSAGASSEQVDFYDMSDDRHQAAFKNFLKDNRTLLPQVFIRLINIPPNFLDWLKTEGITTEIEILDPLQRGQLNTESAQEAAADLQVLKTRVQQAEARLRELEINRDQRKKARLSLIERIQQERQEGYEKTALQGTVTQTQQEMVHLQALRTQIQLEKTMRRIVLWNRKEKNKAILQELIAPSVDVVEAPPVEAAAEQASVSSQVDLSTSSQFIPTKPRAMHIVYQQTSTQQQQATQSQAIRQRLAEMVEEQEVHVPTPGEEFEGGVFSRDDPREAYKAFLIVNPRNPRHSYRLSANPDGGLEEYYKLFWNVFDKIDYMTRGAIEQLAPHQAHFRYGLPRFDNLPQGFSLRPYRGKHVLCYGEIVAADVRVSPLTLRLQDRPQEMLFPKEFDLPHFEQVSRFPKLRERLQAAKTIGRRLNLFLDLMAFEDPKITQKIRDDSARLSLLKEILENQPRLGYDFDLILQETQHEARKKRCLYVIDNAIDPTDDHVSYEVVAENGSIVRHTTPLKAPKPFTRETVEPLREKILEIAEKAGHLSDIVDSEGKVQPLLTRGWLLLWHAGSLGVRVLLEKLQALPEKLRTHFMKVYITTSDDLSEFLTKKGLEALDRLANLTEAQQIWWMDLIPADEEERWKYFPTLLEDAMDAFLYFCEQYQTLSGRDVPQTPPKFCCIWGANITITLDNLLERLKWEKRHAYREMEVFDALEEGCISVPDLKAIRPYPDERCDGFDEYYMRHWKALIASPYREHYRWYRERIFEPILRSKQSEALKRRKLHCLCEVMQGKAFIQAIESGIPLAAVIREFIESHYLDDLATQQYLEKSGKKPEDRDEWVLARAEETFFPYEDGARDPVWMLNNMIALAKWYQHLPIRSDRRHQEYEQYEDYDVYLRAKKEMTLYLEAKDGCIAYTVITPQGEVVWGTTTLKAPEPFERGEPRDDLIKQILDQTSKKGHTDIVPKLYHFAFMVEGMAVEEKSVYLEAKGEGRFAYTMISLEGGIIQDEITVEAHSPPMSPNDELFQQKMHRELVTDLAKKGYIKGAYQFCLASGVMVGLQKNTIYLVKTKWGYSGDYMAITPEGTVFWGYSHELWWNRTFFGDDQKVALLSEIRGKHKVFWHSNPYNVFATHPFEEEKIYFERTKDGCIGYTLMMPGGVVHGETTLKAPEPFTLSELVRRSEEIFDEILRKGHMRAAAYDYEFYPASKDATRLRKDTIYFERTKDGHIGYTMMTPGGVVHDEIPLNAPNPFTLGKLRWYERILERISERGRVNIEMEPNYALYDIEAASLQKGKIYLEATEDGYIAYRMITPSGETIWHKTTLRAPKPFTPVIPESLKQQVLEVASQEGHAIRRDILRLAHPLCLAYLNGELREDDRLARAIENPKLYPFFLRGEVEEELHLSREDFFRLAHERRQKRADLGLQDELSDELFYPYVGGEVDVTFLMKDMISKDPQDSYLAMHHFSRRLMQCEEDRSKFGLYYQLVAAQYILTESPTIHDRHRIELLVRSLFTDHRAREWAKLKLRRQFLSGLYDGDSPPPPNEIGNLSRLTDEQAAILLQALRKVMGDSGTFHLMVEFNDFVGSYFTVPRTQEEVEAALQQRFLFRMETPHPVLIPTDLANRALRFSAQVLIVLKDEATKKDLEAILSEAKVADLIRQLQSADETNALTILLQWMLDIKQSQIPHAFERFQEMALGRQMTAALIGPYREEIKRKANQLSLAQSIFSELSQWLCDFIADGRPIQLEALTLDLLQSYEVRRTKAEKLLSLLSRMQIEADQRAMMVLISNYRALWFGAENRPDIMTVFGHLAEVFQGKEVKRQQELSGLLEKLLERLPEAEDAKTREFDRRIRAAQAIAPAIFRFAEVEGLCDLIVAEGRLQVSDVEHLQDVKGKTPKLFELFFTLYKAGKIDLAQQAFQVIGTLNPTQEMEAELTRVFSPLLRWLNKADSALEEALRKLLLFLSTTTPSLDLNLLKIVLGAYLTPKDPLSELAVPPEELVSAIRAHLGSPERIVALASLYEARPMPSASRLKKALEDFKTDDNDKVFRSKLAAFKVEMERDPEGKRAAQFRTYDRRENLKRAQAVLREIQDLQTERETLPSHRQYQLELDLRYIYAIQNDIPREHPIQAMSQEEICSALRENRRILANRVSSPRARHLAQLKVLALACEVHYRTTGNFPYSTQILSVLMMLNDPRDLILQINTGEGKTLTSVLMAMMLWASQEPHAVDICTANMDLAETGFNAYRAFFQYVGVEATLVRASSAKNTYRQDGINFSTVSELSLYRSRGEALREEAPPESASILLDEVDQSLLDEKTEYRFAMSSDMSQGRVSENVYRWIYPFINAFLESDAYQPRMNRMENVMNLKRFMQSELEQGRLLDKEDKDKSSELLAQLKHFERECLEEWDKQLGQWVASGLGAKMLKLNKDYMIELKEEKDGHFVLEAHILIGGQPNQESKWSHGVHQLLHADLNKKLKEGVDPVFMACVREAFIKAKRKEPKDLMQATFPIEPELSCVDEQTSNSFLMPYKKHIGPEGTRDYRCGRIVGVTGTMGSAREQEELKVAEGFALYRIPPHMGSNRDDRPLQIKKDEEAQYAAILDLLEERGAQPVLIFCRSIEESKRMAEWLSERAKVKGYDVQRADALSIPHPDELITQAGRPGQITVSTFFGRGTDIKPNHPEGLCVIITHLLGDRQLRQVQGRAGRQSQKGKTIEIINRADYPALKGATRRREGERIAEIRHQTEPGDEKQRQYKIRQVDVIINLYADQMGEFGEMILSIWEKRRIGERGGEAAPDEEDLKRSFNRIRAELLDELKPLWDRILETASDLAKKSRKRKGKESSDIEDAYSLLTEDELARCVSDFREQAHRVWITTATRLAEQLPREQDEEMQSRVKGFRNFRPDISDTISLSSRSSSPSPAETPPPPSTPTSVASSSSAASTSSRGVPSSIAIADEQVCQLPHLSLFALESSSTVVLHQLGEESPFKSWEEGVIRQDALHEQFENILSQATSEENLATYTRLLGAGRQRDDFVGRLSQLITNAIGDVRAHPEHLEIAARDYYRGVVRLLQDQLRLKQDAKMMQSLFELLLLPLMQMTDGAQNIVLKQQVRESFLTHVFNIVETRGTDQYAQHLLMQIGDSVKFVGQENQMRNLMVQFLRQYGASKMAPDRRVLVEKLIPDLVQAQGREGIRRVLDGALIQLFQDDRKHHRDYSKPGRCYQLLVQCKQVLEFHDMPDQTRVSLLKADQLRYSMIALLQQYGAHKIAADRRVLVDGLIDKLVRAESTTEAMDRILKEGLKKLLKDDQIHHRNHNKVGRCYQLLIQCQQLLEVHDKTGEEQKKAAVSVVTFFEGQRQEYAKDKNEKLSPKYQPVSTARPFVGVAG